MMATLNKTPTRPQPIFSSKDLAKEYRSPYIRAPDIPLTKFSPGRRLARNDICKTRHLVAAGRGRSNVGGGVGGQVVACTQAVEVRRSVAPATLIRQPSL